MGERVVELALGGQDELADLAHGAVAARLAGDVIRMLPVEVMTEDLYHSGMADDILNIKTYYEQQWLDRGLDIKYIKL